MQVYDGNKIMSVGKLFKDPWNFATTNALGSVPSVSLQQSLLLKQLALSLLVQRSGAWGLSKMPEFKSHFYRD